VEHHEKGGVMTKFLRTASTRRLLGVLGGLVALIAAGTAIAVAAAGSGPVPKAKPLANAVHDALAAKQVPGITARIQFTNHLIDASSIQGSDPLLSGATGRLWLSSDHKLRLELQSNNGDAQAVVNNGKFWIYDPTSKTAYEGTLPAQTSRAATGAKPDKLPTVAEIQKDINKLAQHLNISGAIPSDVAGHPAYTVRVSPKHDGGLLGSAELAVDAAKGVPLRFAIYARGSSSPVIELKATDISYGPVAASTFQATPPSGAKIVSVATPKGQSGSGATSDRADRKQGKHAEVTGAAAVARHLPFALTAPKTLVGLGQQDVKLLDWNHTPAALVTYGKGLGGIAVIEQPAKASGQSQRQGGDQPGLNLPTVSINGATGQELDTALGTLLRFTRGGISYTVIGSVPASAAELAARAL
jgi:outer membrane lipoprotein-sorting protein